MPLPTCFGQTGPLFVVPLAIAAFVLLAFLVALVVLMQRNYKRCPPNRLLVVYGKTGRGHSAKVFHGGAAFVIPLLQDYAYLSLEPVPLELPKLLHSRGLDKGITLPKTWTVAIGADEPWCQNAAIRLLGLRHEEVERLAADLIVGRLERCLDQLENSSQPRDATGLPQQWAAKIEEDLAEVGLKTVGYR